MNRNPRPKIRITVLKDSGDYSFVVDVSSNEMMGFPAIECSPQSLSKDYKGGPWLVVPLSFTGQGLCCPD